MIEIRLKKPKDIKRTTFNYSVAGLHVVSDTEIESLQHLAIPNSCEAALSPVRLRPAKEESENLLYTGTSTLFGAQQTVFCWENKDVFSLRMGNLGQVLIDRECNVVRITRNSPNSLDGLVKIASGPALILALALHNVYCLHASAANINGRLCLFLGESGRGKSTLVSYSKFGLERVCDDVLPVAFNNNRLMALPHFPQLKLGKCDQYGLDWPETCRVKQVFLLNNRGPLSPSAKISLRRLNKTEVTTAILRHTVAAKLFSSGLLRRHMQFSASVAEASNVTGLDYPMGLAKVPKILELVCGSRKSNTD